MGRRNCSVQKLVGGSEGKLIARYHRRQRGKHRVRVHSTRSWRSSRSLALILSLSLHFLSTLGRLHAYLSEGFLVSSDAVSVDVTLLDPLRVFIALTPDSIAFDEHHHIA